MHPFDRYFYDRGSGSGTTTTTTTSSSSTARNYTVDHYLDDAAARYGRLRLDCVGKRTFHDLNKDMSVTLGGSLSSCATRHARSSRSDV